MMPRTPRQKSATGVYHVMTRGINKQDIFHDDEDRKKYLEIVEKVRRSYPFILLAYCLMNNHVHLLIREVDENISQIMKRIGTRYAMYYNAKYGRVGHLFQDRYKSEKVEDEAYLLTVIRYILQNPVKAKIVTRVQDYQWSSYGAYFGKMGTAEVEIEFIKSFFGDGKKDTLANFQRFIEANNNDKCLDDHKTVMSNEQLEKELLALLKGLPKEALTNIKRKERNEIIRQLKAQEGASIRQIVEVTGLSRNIVADA